MTYSQSLEITDVADTQDLTVLATAKDELGIAQADTSQDAQLARWIHEASSLINSQVNRVLGRETVRETFECGYCGHIGPLPLSRYPVAIIDSISSPTQSLSNTDYRLDANKGLLYRNFGRWVGEIVVNYQAGYQLLQELPFDLERACLQLMRYRKTSALRDPSIRSEEVPGVYNVSYWVGIVPGSDAAMPADVTSMLAPYRDLPI